MNARLPIAAGLLLGTVAFLPAPAAAEAPQIVNAPFQGILDAAYDTAWNATHERPCVPVHQDCRLMAYLVVGCTIGTSIECYVCQESDAESDLPVFPSLGYGGQYGIGVDATRDPSSGDYGAPYYGVFADPTGNC